MNTWHIELSNISENARIGEGCTIHAGVHIHDDVEIGDNCLIQAMVYIPNGVRISSNVFIGPATVFTNDKGLQVPDGEFTPLKTQINANVRIGANCTILPGITIGEGAKIGAGSVVTKDVPAGETWFGNPARPH